MGELILEAKNYKRYHRRSIRLKRYDYSQTGAYFITICAYNRGCLFGEIVNDDIRLNEYGIIAKNEWIKSPEIRKEIRLDEHIVMPNHIHGIIWIDNFVGANGRSPLQRTNMGSKTLSSFVAGYKSTVAKQINELRQLPGVSVWQRNYYEHVIRNDQELNRLREYIVNNPKQWALDTENINVGAPLVNALNNDRAGTRPAHTKPFTHRGGCGIIVH